MPEITVTETQQDTLEEIRSDLSVAYIDTYGQIRTTDVIQYLLDTYTHPEDQRSDVAHERIATAEFPVLQQVATDVEGVPGSGIDTETMRGELLSALGVEEFAARLEELEPSATEPGMTEDSDAETSVATAADDADAPMEGHSSAEDGEVTDIDGAENDEGETTATSEDSDDDGDADADGSTTPAAGSPDATNGSDAILSAANQLLADHDDKWRKGSGNEPYEVDMPDGTTEDVRTKDDVKQLLFKHY